MKMIFRTMRNGNKRWFLLDENGKKLAKFYSQPTADYIFGTAVMSAHAAAEYRARVNERCARKGKAPLYQD